MHAKEIIIHQFVRDLPSTCNSHQAYRVYTTDSTDLYFQNLPIILTNMPIIPA